LVIAGDDYLAKLQLDKQHARGRTIYRPTDIIFRYLTFEDRLICELELYNNKTCPIIPVTDIIGRYFTSNIGIGFKNLISVGLYCMFDGGLRINDIHAF